MIFEKLARMLQAPDFAWKDAKKIANLVKECIFRKTSESMQNESRTKCEQKNFSNRDSCERLAKLNQQDIFERIS